MCANQGKKKTYWSWKKVYQSSFTSSNQIFWNATRSKCYYPLNFKSCVIHDLIHDISNLANWLKVNKIFLTFGKTELVLFTSTKKQLNNDLEIKLNGKRLYELDPATWNPLFQEDEGGQFYRVLWNLKFSPTPHSWVRTTGFSLLMD